MKLGIYNDKMFNLEMFTSIDLQTDITKGIADIDKNAKKSGMHENIKKYSEVETLKAVLMFRESIVIIPIKDHAHYLKLREFIKDSILDTTSARQIVDFNKVI